MAKRGKQKQKGKPAETAKTVATAAPVGDVDAGMPADGVDAAASPAVPEASVAAGPAPDLDAGAERARADAVSDDAAPGASGEAGEGAADATDADGAPGADAPTRQQSRGRRRRAPARTSPQREQVSPYLVLADYEQRSLAHVAGLPEQLDAPGLWRGVAYRVGGHRLASGFNEVVEILPMPALTPVPGSLPWMLGVANVRGALLPVVDLKQFLDGERTILHESQRVLVVRQQGGDVAVTIDELFGQRSFVEAQAIETPVEVSGRYAHFVDRSYRVGEHDWGVFSLDRLTRTPEFRQAAA